MRTGARGSKRVAVTSLLVLELAACGDDPAAPDIREVQFVAELGIDIATFTETTSGLFYRDVIVGQGDLAGISNYVLVNLQGWLADGTRFQAPVDFPFTIGAHEVIRGVDEGVIGMRVGGERTLVIPPNLGYGSRGFDPIPGNAVIVFHTRLLSVSTRSDPEGVRLAPPEPRPSWREARP